MVIGIAFPLPCLLAGAAAPGAGRFDHLFIIRATHATRVIEHEPADNATLPKLPGYLD